MDFVTKKEFEAALLVIKKALEGGQLAYALHGSDRAEVKEMRFQNDTDIFTPEQVTFVPAKEAVKNKLHSLRKNMSSLKEHTNKTQKELEDFEILERKLVNLIPLLKE